ncbi:MAG: BMC domain-containing protein [Clostridia bacterium]|nr:BMC domain-containing protein [Clostridia bacterium]
MNNAFGMIEVYSFTTAVVAADTMAKTGNVKVIAFDRNRPFNPGFPVPLIMGAKIMGNVADVKASVEAAKAYAEGKGHYIVSHVIPNPGEGVENMTYLMDINKDKFNKKLPKNLRGAEDVYEVEGASAIGLLEVEGNTAAIIGLDAMVKAADVRLVHTEKRLGGRLVTLIVAGKVDAVTAALERGKTETEPYSKTYGCEVIANPHTEILKFFDMTQGLERQ